MDSIPNESERLFVFIVFGSFWAWLDANDAHVTIQFPKKKNEYQRKRKIVAILSFKDQS